MKTLLTIIAFAAYLLVLWFLPVTIKLIVITLSIVALTSYYYAYLVYMQEKDPDFQNTEFNRQYRILDGWIHNPDTNGNKRFIKGMFTEIRGLKASKRIGNQEKLAVLESEFERRFE
jgi:hypothetical protein